MYDFNARTEDIVAVALAIAAISALFRCSQVFIGLYRMMKSRRDRLRWDASMIIAFPEPFLLAMAAVALYATSLGEDTSLAAMRAATGASLSLAGIGLFLWSLVSYREVGTGHYLDAGHRLSTGGAYALVRHPLYLAALMEWFGLGTAFGSVPTLALAALYVLPAYLYYAWSEERMMLGAFGEEYRAYRKHVPMLIPWTQRS